MISFHGMAVGFSMILTTLTIGGCAVTRDDADLSQDDDGTGAETLESTAAELASRGGYIPPMKGKGGRPSSKGYMPQHPAQPVGKHTTLEPPVCGGIAGFGCPTGLVCVDDPRDYCDPGHGGADCGGICVPEH